MTVGEIVRRYGGAYLRRQPAPPVVQQTLRALAACRTAALGGHVNRCNHCAQVTYHYHSCGNRHCPQCGGNKRAAWLEKRQADLLPVPYFHVVFTLPHQLSALVLGNRKLLYGLLFDAAAQTLLQLAADPKHLGARIGVLMVLHTWGQQLNHHPHVHAVVPGGGLTAHGSHWRSCRPNFFVPEKVLGRLFRGKYLAALQQAYAAGELQFAGSTAALAEPAAFRTWLRTLYAIDWVVYAKKPFGGPEQVLKYLTKYTHRVAIGNSRLVRLVDDQVTFTWKDYADDCQTKELTLDALEFVRRFALHILPRGLVRIRYYGLLANRGRQQRLAHCRELLAAAAAGPGTPSREPSAAAPAQPVAGSEPPALPATGTNPWLVPCLLAGLLLVLADANTLPPSAVAAAVAALVTAGPPRLCPACGLSTLETIWQAPRPTGRQLASRWIWDSS